MKTCKAIQLMVVGVLAPGLDEVDSRIHGLKAGTFNLTAAPAPEPSTYALMLAGIALVGFMSYRRQRYFN